MHRPWPDPAPPPSTDGEHASRHRSPPAARRRRAPPPPTPHAQPSRAQLWSAELDQIPGTITNATRSEYVRMHRQFGLPAEPDDLDKRCRPLCKLFVGPHGAITRMHQDNHHAHAWLTNIRGRKLYVLCSPDVEASLVAPRGCASQDGGTTREARFDPLDASHRASRPQLELHAVVLEEGETIVAPSGWWHYAATLTPTITLMCNFWDGENIDGLHDCFYEQAARALDSIKRRHGAGASSGRSTSAKSKAAPLVAASAASAPRELPGAPVAYTALHRPWVYLRASPSTAAEMVAIVRPGREVLCSVEHDGWLRTAQPVSKGQHGWLLVDGAKLGLGLLVAPTASLEQASRAGT